MKRFCAALLAMIMTAVLTAVLTAALPAALPADALGGELRTVRQIPSSRDKYPRFKAQGTTSGGLPVSSKRFKTTKDSTGSSRKAMPQNPASLQ